MTAERKCVSNPSTPSQTYATSDEQLFLGWGASLMLARQYTPPAMVDPIARAFSEALWPWLYIWRRADARCGALQDQLAVALLRDNEKNWPEWYEPPTHERSPG